MDIPSYLILIAVLGIPTLIAVALVFGVRYLFRRAGHERLYDDGVVMTDNGIEYLGFFFTGIRRVAYSDIASVELVPSFQLALFQMVHYYGFFPRTIKRKLFGKVVVIRFRNSISAACLFFMSRKPEDFYEQLKSKIRQETHVA